jgi:hypothetical protein
VIRAGSRSDRGGFVLLDNVRRDAPALADCDALVFRPRPDIAAALTARSSTHRAGALSPSRLAGMVNVGRDLPAEPAGILLAEVDLVVGAAEPEPQRLIRRAPSRSSSSSTLTRCAIMASMVTVSYLHRTRSTATP